MSRWIPCFALLLLAGCATPAPKPSPPASSSVPEKASQKLGCPDDLEVRITYREVKPSLQNENPENHYALWEKGPFTYLLHETLVEDEKDKLWTSADPGQEASWRWKKITPEEAAAHGATLSDDPVWVYPEGSEKPCSMTPGEFWTSRGGDGIHFTAIARELTGDCLNTSKVLSAYALRGSEKEVASCLWREGQPSADPAAPELSELAKTPIPQKLSDMLSAAKCQSPQCDLRTSWRGDLKGPSEIHDVVVTRVYPTEAGECEWKFKDHHEIMVRTAEGPYASFPLEEYSLFSYRGGFYDDRGFRHFVLDDGLGDFEVYKASDLSKAAQRTTWTIPHEESRESLSLAPYCGP